MDQDEAIKVGADPSAALALSPEWTSEGARLNYLRMHEASRAPSPAAPRLNKLLISRAIVLGLTVIVLAAIFGWPRIKKARAQSRIEELLPEFEQVSDKFTRPKVFMHKAFKDIAGEGQPKHFASAIRAYSDGGFRMPDIIPYKGGRYDDGRYEAVINLNDTIFHLVTYVEGDRAKFLGHAVSVLNHEDISLAVRISPEYSSKITKGEYTVQGSELSAFMKTIELTHLFKVVSE